MKRFLLGTSRILGGGILLLAGYTPSPPDHYTLEYALLSSTSFKLVLVVIGFSILGIGQFLYTKFRNKKEEAEDQALEAEGKKKLQEGMNALKNLKPNIETLAANKLQDLLSKGNSSSTADKIRELDSLKKDGIITEDEFSNAKKKLLEMK